MKTKKIAVSTNFFSNWPSNSPSKDLFLSPRNILENFEDILYDNKEYLSDLCQQKFYNNVFREIETEAVIVNCSYL